MMKMIQQKKSRYYKKIRAAHFEQLSGRVPRITSEPPGNSTITHKVKKTRRSEIDIYYER